MRRTREVSGPGLNGPAVIAKMPAQRPPEYMILARRQEEEARRVFEDKLQEESRIRQRSQFEKMTDARIKEKAIAQKATAYLQQADLALEERRAKLAALLQAEESMYIDEVNASIETPIERLARMRERVRSLKSKRETERSTIATQKLDEHWTHNCEPLRAVAKATMHKQIDLDRKHQIEEKQRIQLHEKNVDAMYAACWEADKLAKDERAEFEGQYRKEVAMHILDGQMQQLAERQMAREAEAREMEEEKAYRLQQDVELKEEELMTVQQAIDKKHRLKRILDKDSEERTALAASMKREALDDDLKILDQIEKDRRDAAEHARLTKERLGQDQKEFLKYTAQFKLAEMDADQQRDAYIKAENERIAQIQLNKRKAIIAQRKQNTAACLESHKKMIEYRDLEQQTERAAKIAEKEQADLEVLENTRLLEDMALSNRQRNVQLQKDLISQMEEKEHRKEAQRIEEMEADEKVMTAKREELDRMSLTITAIKTGSNRRGTLRR